MGGLEWKVNEHHIKMEDFGVPPFEETSKSATKSSGSQSFMFYIIVIFSIFSPQLLHFASHLFARFWTPWMGHWIMKHPDIPYHLAGSVPYLSVDNHFLTAWVNPQISVHQHLQLHVFNSILSMYILKRASWGLWGSKLFPTSNPQVVDSSDSPPETRQNSACLHHIVRTRAGKRPIKNTMLIGMKSVCV